MYSGNNNTFNICKPIDYNPIHVAQGRRYLNDIMENKENTKTNTKTNTNTKTKTNTNTKTNTKTKRNTKTKTKKVNA